jgi:hypothetical protein
MDTISVLTLRLAQAIGVYLAAVGIGGLIRRGRWQAIIAEFDRSPALTFVTGSVTFAIGAAIFGVHHTLQDPLAALVTIFAAAILIKGLLLVAIPDALFGLVRPLAGLIRIWPIIALIVGVVLFLLGYLGRATVLIA